MFMSSFGISPKIIIFYTPEPLTLIPQSPFPLKSFWEVLKTDLLYSIQPTITSDPSILVKSPFPFVYLKSACQGCFLPLQLFK